MVGIIPAEMITDAGHCSTLHIHELSWALLDFPSLDSLLPSPPGASLGLPGPFLGIFCRHNISSSFISHCTYHASHITPCTSHFTPCTLALHATTPASQAETLVRQEETPAGQEETSASQEESLASQEEAPANQAETPASQEETPADFS